MKNFFLSLAVILFCSCESKITSEDVRLVGNEIYYDNQPYSGQLWTKDGESLVVEVSDGRPVKFTLFHDNGKPAMIVTYSAGDKEKAYFDINGYKMTKGEWISKYPNISMKRSLIDEELNHE